jgi:hypothetical protein
MSGHEERVQFAIDVLNGKVDLRQEALRRDHRTAPPPGYPSKEDFARAGEQLRVRLIGLVSARPELYRRRRDRDEELLAIAFLAERLGPACPPWFSEPVVLAHFDFGWAPELARAIGFREKRWRPGREGVTEFYVRREADKEEWVSAFLAVVDLKIRNGDTLSGLPPPGLELIDVDDVEDWAAPLIRHETKSLSIGVEREAARLFLLLLRSPWSVGQCHCGTWFLNTSGQPKRKACSHDCAQDLVNERVKKKLHQQRKDEREGKLERAQAAVVEFEDDDRRKRPSWKAWVAARASKGKGPRVTTNFITRMVKKGLLRPPKESR